MLEINSTSVADKSMTVFLSGYIDITTASILTTYVEQLDGLHHKTLSLNFKDVSFIDSTGIGAILKIIFSSQDQDFEVKLEEMSTELKDILEMVGVFRILEAVQRD